MLDPNECSVESFECDCYKNVIGEFTYDSSLPPNYAYHIDFYKGVKSFNPHKIPNSDEIILPIYIYCDGFYTHNWNAETYDAIRFELMDVPMEYRNNYYFKITEMITPSCVDKRSVLKVTW